MLFHSDTYPDSKLSVLALTLQCYMLYSKEANNTNNIILDLTHPLLKPTICPLESSMLRPKKYICVFTVTCQKNLGSVGRSRLLFFFLLSAKPEIDVLGSGIRFRYFIFEISGKMTNYAVFLPSLLSNSTKS